MNSAGNAAGAYLAGSEVATGPQHVCAVPTIRLLVYVYILVVIKVQNQTIVISAFSHLYITILGDDLQFSLHL